MRSEELWYRLAAMIIFLRASSYRRKIATLFADLHLLRDWVGGADFVLRYYLCLISDFCMLFLIKSAPCRLTPIEALPQTPTGLCPVPTRDSVPCPCKPSNAGLEPAFYLSLRSVLGAQLWSAMPIPHSSFLIPHLTGNSPSSTISSAISLISSQS